MDQHWCDSCQCYHFHNRERCCKTSCVTESYNFQEHFFGRHYTSSGHDCTREKICTNIAESNFGRSHIALVEPNDCSRNFHPRSSEIHHGCGTGNLKEGAFNLEFYRKYSVSKRDLTKSHSSDKVVEMSDCAREYNKWSLRDTNYKVPGGSYVGTSKLAEYSSRARLTENDVVNQSEINENAR
ncbi:hypothetical protein RRG08_046510 [Elysia crispata]|uniref:Uncharacterized protein n=1 Tax=Elysia crispata TaxID=231223 RepID=A0AAE1DBP4_9GAST|nr:hypothetical protein RRG08_046510 [Elysia crispata]